MGATARCSPREPGCWGSLPVLGKIAAMSRDEVEHFLTALGSFTRSGIASVFKTPAAPHSATTVVAACAWLSSMDPGTPTLPREHFIDALETLAASKHATAPHALKLIADKAANASIRVEAIRRRGRASAKVEVRKLRHSLSTGQSSPTAGFRGETINDDEFKRAAVQAIGEMAKPTVADTELVLGVLKADVESRSDSALFRTAAESLCRLAGPSNLECLVDAATSLTDSPMALDILSICAKYSRRALLVHGDKLSDALARSLHHLPKRDGLRDRLCDLARQATCARYLSERARIPVLGYASSHARRRGCLGCGRGLSTCRRGSRRRVPCAS